ncbi:MAG: methyltransferase [Anaerolineaceae bacterium]|nr:methyltransferase [Anaerolineaceae bacterium]
MKNQNHLENIRKYFDTTLKTHGPSPRGVDWNTEEARDTRFEQLIKIIAPSQTFSILDYGCGYGALTDYLRKKSLNFSQFMGYDIAESMISVARERYAGIPGVAFTTLIDEVSTYDYATACGVFNMKINADKKEWDEFVIHSLTEMDAHSRLGFSVNFLTKYSDPDKMRSDLYYADPCFLFDYCKTHFSKNVALLHDYNLFDFTILVRKSD